MRLTASCSARLSPPGCNRLLREPDCEATSLAQGRIVFRPVRHPVPLLRDVMTASSVGFEWHDRHPKSGGQLSYAIPVRPPNRLFVQQGNGSLLIAFGILHRTSGIASFASQTFAVGVYD